MTIEKRFDIPFVAGMALREKQVQQNYRPIIAVHKWFARRPGTLFRALLLAEFSEKPIRDGFFESHTLDGISVLDPFMGGGTPLFEANRLGCAVTGFDINPMAHWIVRQEIETLDLAAYRTAGANLLAALSDELGDLYQTRCLKCGSVDAAVKYFLWVKTIRCSGCPDKIDLFPGYLISQDVRHPKNVYVCATCGELTETADRKEPGPCSICGSMLLVEGPAKRGTCKCKACGTSNRYPSSEYGPLGHRMFAIEYHCPQCKRGHEGRFFKKPDAADLMKYDEAKDRWHRLQPNFVPPDEIPPGDETDRLHRWGYQRYRELFNERQLLGLETSARLLSACGDERTRRALATNLSDLLRYQNMLCRYDTMALKSLDIFSVHGFPVGLVQCESNLLGISPRRVVNPQRNLFDLGQEESGPLIGSGGWANIIDKYTKAKAYCEAPFEVRFRGKKKVIVPTCDEWIGDVRTGQPMSRKVDLQCMSSTNSDLSPGTFDAVFTDPPYFGNVQYAELMDFCYVWLKRLVKDEAFASESTRNEQELTGNTTLQRDLAHFAEGISAVFVRAAAALKPGGPLAFTYHHNDFDAYLPIMAGILDSGLQCTAVIPCPAEMAASIHISGTSSSVIDTIFVCRAVPEEILESFTREILNQCVSWDTAQLEKGGVRITKGDRRCITYGHLARWAILDLRPSWDSSVTMATKLGTIGRWARSQRVSDLLPKEGRSLKTRANQAPDDDIYERAKREGTDAHVPV